ncbi:MAG: hypothetical protein CBB96_03500 [Gammaproteobacteria bacterium TMED36]|jgi:hypothetical protein|nr:MAG: hypothetical protein CBB96_03500 [Gammaproteobacteria bacterium TMED36]|tara:strand:+ start:52 stop:465 length:414 start_codon:yes stop_codon:yes gene_type:complete
MGIEDDFYATIKLNSGEEIFAKVAASEETDRTMLIVHHPIVIGELKGKHGVVGYKVEPWLKTSKEDMFIINLNNVLTLSESNDVEMIIMYQRYLRDSEDDRTPESKISKKMGYVANVKDAKEILEKIYKNKNNNTKS